MRGAKVPQVVHVEKQDPGAGVWVPVSVTGQGCDQGTEFSTDATGDFLRLAPYDGDAAHRMTVRQADGSFAPSIAIPVSR